MSVDVELRWGYTLGDLQRIARGAAATTRAMAGDRQDRFEEAFSGAAEALCAADEWVPERVLFGAALDALSAAAASFRQSRGLTRGTSQRPAGTRPAFECFWADTTAPTPSPEDRVVERLALAQILPVLTPQQREVLVALAAFGDHRAAAASLGINGFSAILSRARRQFFAEWHEDEVPSRLWARDFRNSGESFRKTMWERRRRHKTRPDPVSAPDAGGES